MQPDRLADTSCATHSLPMSPARIATLITALFASAASMNALAQQPPPRPPDAGTILKEVTPPPAPPQPPPAPLPTPQPSAVPAPEGPAVSFVLNSVRFNGNTVFPSETFAPFTADKIGKQVTLADLNEIATRVTALYRQRGYVLAQAIIPRQDVTAGDVEVSVLEGRIGRVRIERAAEAPVSDAHVAGMLAAIKPGEPLRQADLERSMLLLSDTPGIDVQSELEAGTESGTTDLIVQVAPRRHFDFTLDADNYGLTSSGEYRIGAALRVNGPFDFGDNFDLRLMESSGSGVTFGRAGYELPLGVSGARLSAGVARLEYALGEDFAALGSTGQAYVSDAAVTYPVIRSRTSNLFAKVSYEYKRLTDNLESVHTSVGKRDSLWGAGAVYEWRDPFLGGGYTSLSGTLYAGDLDINDPVARALDESDVGRHTQGSFTKIVYQLSRLQTVTARSNLFVGLTGQWASKNLDSAEKVALGGPRAVRAYPTSEAVADEAEIATVEYRFSVMPELTLSAFYDAGWAKVNEDPLPSDSENYRSLRGYGIGIYWGQAGNIAVQASLAWRATGRAVSDKDHNPRLYVQAVKAF